MKYEDFEKFIKEKCMYDTIYDDSNGRQVLIIQMLDAYGMLNKAQREWVGLTEPAECDGGQCGIGGYCKECPKTQPDVPEIAFGETKPVLYQVRGRPNWDTEPKWGEWKFCTEPVANDYIKTPVLHDWEYQVRSLYTTPPQREWVGLTREELAEIAEFHFHGALSGREFYDDVETKLKEKNT